MLRKIIKIDEHKCNGCALCVSACHEGAIGLVNGKAKLLRDDYCDGLGDCLPACPTGAISFETREAAPYDEAAVLANLRAAKADKGQALPPAGCPGSGMTFNELRPSRPATCPGSGPATCPGAAPRRAGINNWPLQLKLAPVQAPYFAGADLLIAADCTAFACAEMHERFFKSHVTLIGCPKLDQTDYAEKLAAVLKHNNINSVSVARMEVPCCAGLVHMVERALRESGKDLPLRVSVITIDGQIFSDRATDARREAAQ